MSASLIALALMASPALAVADAAKPPVAPVRPGVDNYFGTKVADNYRRMENLKDPPMQRWMKAQDDYTRATLDADTLAFGFWQTGDPAFQPKP